MTVVRRATILIWISGPVTSVVLAMHVPFAILGKSDPGPEFFGAVAASVISCSIWTLYLSKSKRVQATYTTPVASTTNHRSFEPDDSIERKVAKSALALQTAGIVVPIGVADIPDFPCNDFDDLQQHLRDRRLLLQRFSIHREHWIEQALTEPHQNSGAFPVGAVLTAVGVVALAISVSLWSLLALIVVPIQLMRYAKTISGAYDQKVLRAAAAYETAFCMLYRLKQINLTSPDYQTAWYWNSDSQTE